MVSLWGRKINSNGICFKTTANSPLIWKAVAFAGFYKGPNQDPKSAESTEAVET